MWGRIAEEKRGERAALRAGLAVLLVIHCAGCASDGVRPATDLPLLLSDSQAIVVPRDEIRRYRCASGGILQCGGPSGQTAECLCSPLPRWPAP